MTAQGRQHSAQRGRSGWDPEPPEERTGAHTGPPPASFQDPAGMAPTGRLAELGALLTRAFRRLKGRQKALAEGAETERPCDPVDSPENQEVA